MGGLSVFLLAVLFWLVCGGLWLFLCGYFDIERRWASFPAPVLCVLGPITLIIAPILWITVVGAIKIFEFGERLGRRR